MGHNDSHLICHSQCFLPLFNAALQVFQAAGMSIQPLSTLLCLARVPVTFSCGPPPQPPASLGNPRLPWWSSRISYAIFHCFTSYLLCLILVPISRMWQHIFMKCDSSFEKCFSPLVSDLCTFYIFSFLFGYRVEDMLLLSCMWELLCNWPSPCGFLWPSYTPPVFLRGRGFVNSKVGPCPN
jgi:hypothetical protein